MGQKSQKPPGQNQGKWRRWVLKCCGKGEPAESGNAFPGGRPTKTSNVAKTPANFSRTDAVAITDTLVSPTPTEADRCPSAFDAEVRKALPNTDESPPTILNELPANSSSARVSASADTGLYLHPTEVEVRMPSIDAEPRASSQDTAERSRTISHNIFANTSSLDVAAPDNPSVGSISLQVEADVCATTTDDDVRVACLGDDVSALSVELTELPATGSSQSHLWDEALKRVALKRGEDSKQNDKIIDRIQEFSKHVAKNTHAGSKLDDLAIIKEGMEQVIADKDADRKARAWSIIVGNKEYSWRGFVETTVDILNKFTPIADLAVSADPVHAALPWAAVRVVLMAVTAGNKLRSDIIFGLTKVTTLIYYCDTYQKLYMVANEPSHTDSPILDRLREAIIQAYVQSLFFLGFAYLQHDRSNTVALFKVEEMGNYIQALSDIGDELVQAANDCERHCGIESRAKMDDLIQLATEFRETVNNQEKLISDIYRSVYLCHLKTQLAEGAEFDSLENENDPKCHEDTRVDLLNGIENWFNDDEGKTIFWLQGKAGTGKSTISRTIAQRLHNTGGLGASFFFKRGAGDRSHAKRFFTTISYQLCRKWPTFAECVEQAICEDHTIMTKKSSYQLKKLILEPLAELSKIKHGILRTVVVIDALDECDEDENIKNIVSLLPEVKRLTKMKIYLKFFITSRPENHLEHGFKGIDQDHYELALHDIQDKLIQADIRTYLKHELSMIRIEREDEDNPPLEEGWPGEENVMTLARLASPLFVFAATVCRFLRENPREGLDRVLAEKVKTHDGDLNGAYLPVFQRFLKVNQNRSGQGEAISRFLKVVGSIVLLEEPLSVSSLAQVLDIDESKIRSTIKPLHSVLNIPRGNSKLPIRTFHLSFREYLLDKERNVEGRLQIDQEKTHENLAIGCLNLLLRLDVLKENICCLGKPSMSRKEIDQGTLDDHIPPVVRYGCRFWIRHLIKSNIKIDDQHLAYKFLEKHFLHWIEVLSLLGRLSEGLGLIRELQTAISPNGADKVLGFLQDANRFIMHSYAAIDPTPLQLYSSALLFAPQASIIRKSFQKHIRWIVHKPMVESEWSPCLQTLDGHGGAKSSIAVSGNGKLIASAGEHDGLVKLWDTATGALRTTFEGHADGAAAVALSDDGKLVAHASLFAIRVWDTETEVLQHEFGGGEFWSVAFSKDGRLASGMSSGQIKVWVALTGVLDKEWQDHDDDDVLSVAFSPDSTILVSGSADTIKVWDPATSELKKTLTGHSSDVASMAFSNDGKYLVSEALFDNTARIWDAETWEPQDILQNEAAESVTFSRDSKLLAFTSNLNIKIWDMATQKLQKVLEGHASPVESLVFQDGGLMISGSEGGTIRIWDISKTSPQHIFQRHGDPIESIFISPDDELIASISPKTIKVWDAEEGTPCLEIRSGMSRGMSRFPNNDGSFAFSPDSKLVAWGSGHTIGICNITSGKLEHALKSHTQDIASITFSASGKFLASGSWDNTVKVWDTITGTIQYTLKDYPNAITLIVFSLDAEFISSASEDGTVTAWDTAQAALQQGTGVPNNHTVMEPQAQNTTELYSGNYGFTKNVDWVTKDGENLIWIHPRYRPVDLYTLDAWVISHSRKKIAITFDYGRIVHFGF